VNSGSWSTIQNTMSLGRGFSGKSDATYHYRVRACNSLSCSAFTSTKSIQVLRTPGVPGAISGPANDTDGAYAISWASASGAVSSYQLQERVNSGSWSTIQNTSALSRSFSGKGNATYDYRVRACNALSCSPFTAVKTVLVLQTPSVPGAISGPVNSSSGSYSLSWGAASGAVATYQLQERLNSGSWSTIQDASALSRSLSGKGNGTYDYRVRACNSLSCSAYSAIRSVEVLLTPGVVPNLSAPSESGSGSYTVSWGTASGSVATYQLQEQLNGGTWSTVQNTAATNRSVSGKSAGTYGYRVRACNALSCSAYSGTVSVYVVHLANIADPPTIEVPNAAGSAAYSADVDGSGDARIRIPIATSPGVNGLAPSLALTYSSGGGRAQVDARRVAGVLGYGWSLAGLSELRRCRIGVSGDVDSSNSDRLCLDGQPLVAVNGSSYWADGAEYRTERQSLLKVIGHGTGANASFEVLLPDGGTAWYGDVASSRAVAIGGSVPYAWGLRRQTDAFGNELIVGYATNPAGGTNYPIAIDYAGARVEFFYERRDDTAALSYGFTEFAQTAAQRMVALNRITIAVNGTAVREYRLRNVQHPEGYLHLEDIQLCGYDNAGLGASCLAPVSLAWNVGTGLPDEFTCAVTEVTDGVGAQTQFDYAMVSGSGTNPLQYGEAPFGSFTAPPNTTPISSSRRVVSELRRPDGLGSFRRTSYGYKGVPMTSTQNRGFLGFAERRETRHDVPDHDVSGAVTVRDVTRYVQYRLDFPFIGQVSQQLEVLDQNVTSPTARLSHQEQAWASQALLGGTVVAPYLARRAERSYEDGAVVSATETEQSPCYRALSAGSCPGSGTLLEHATQLVTVSRTGTSLSEPSFSPGFWGDVPNRSVAGELSSVMQTASFENDTGDWVLGFVAEVTTVQDTPTADAVTRTEQRTRLPGTRRMESGTRFPGDIELDLTVINSFDLNGNVTQVQVVGQEVPSRTTSLAGFLDQRYPQTITNPLSHATTLGYDRRFGNTTQTTDPDGRITETLFDPFGRVTAREHADGNIEQVQIEPCGGSLCSEVTWADAALRETVSTTNVATQTAPTTRIYRDTLGREVLRETEAFDPADGWVRIETRYDAAGRAIEQSLPYFSAGGVPEYVEVDHDVLGRVVREARPDGGITQTSYAGSAGQTTVTVTETVKTPGQADTTRAKRSVFDARGLLVSTTDAFGTAEAVTTTYAYDGALNLASVTVDGTEVASMAYDAAGNRISIDEINTGLTTFDYDALGRLRDQTDANGLTSTLDYDDLDRLISRVDGGGTAGATTSTWTWDPLNATGELASRSRDGFTETLSYDALGRVTQLATTVSVSGFPGNGGYDITLGYDGAGRLATTTWPSGLVVSRDYTARGYGSALRQDSTVLEAVEALAASGQIRRTGYGNGLATQRSYDVLGRVSSIATGPSATPASIQDLEYTWRSNSTLYQRRDNRGTTTTGDDRIETFSYDALDRLISAQTSHETGSRILSFGYDAVGNLTSKTSTVAGDAEVTGYQYTGLHRLNSAVIDGVSTTFDYDAAGNITRYNAASGANTVLAYDARGQVESITVGSTEDAFHYGPDGARYLKQSSRVEDSTAQTAWTLYLAGGAYEETHPVGDAEVLVRQQVQVSRTVIHRRTVTPIFTATERIEYRHRDHLGSVDKVTDESGNLVTDLAFDPFGDRREPDWSRALTSAALDLLLEGESTTQRGFTDHEHLDRTGFIHMTGRVYDPRLGRFVQPDPIIQAPAFSQSYNRYAYVFNDPLSLADPSGFMGLEIVTVVAPRLGGGFSPGGLPAVGHTEFLRAKPGSYQRRG